MYIGNTCKSKRTYRRYDRKKNKHRMIWGILACILFMGILFFARKVHTGEILLWIGRNVPRTSETLPEEEAMQDALMVQYRETAEVGEVTASATGTDVIDTVLPMEPDTDLIVIDPGHGGEDEGCERENVFEKDINLQLALALQARLTDMGYEVILTRSEDVALTLDERVEIANSSGADLFISIHQNAYEGREAAGIETWYSSNAPGKDSSRLARLLHRNVLEETEAFDRGIQQTDELKVIRETRMPACLVETGFLSNAAERKLLADAEYQSKIVSGLADGIELYFHPKTMYLTFDDGPTAENTCAVLDILKEKNIKATFFVVGENVKKHPEVARRIVEEGHTIGIHCNNHDYDTLYASVDSYVADFQEAYEIVYEVTGVEPRLFRFPGGSINSYNKSVYKEIIEEMEKKGFIYFDWNASLEDAVKKSEPEQLIQNARESTMGRQKVVMLAHDIVYNTTLCLDELIEEFPEYKMEPLTVDIEPIQF